MIHRSLMVFAWFFLLWRWQVVLCQLLAFYEWQTPAVAPALDLSAVAGAIGDRICPWRGRDFCRL